MQAKCVVETWRDSCSTWGKKASRQRLDFTVRIAVARKHTVDRSVKTHFNLFLIHSSAVWNSIIGATEKCALINICIGRPWFPFFSLSFDLLCLHSSSFHLLHSFFFQEQFQIIAHFTRNFTLFSFQMNYATIIYEGWRDLMDNKSDPRTREWLLMSSPFPTIAISLTYAYCVKVCRVYFYIFSLASISWKTTMNRTHTNRSQIETENAVFISVFCVETFRIILVFCERRGKFRRHCVVHTKNKLNCCDRIAECRCNKNGSKSTVCLWK